MKIISEADNYAVTEDGHVWSFRVGRFMKPRVVPSGKGYLQVTLISSAGEKMQRYVHRLVAEAYLPNLHGKLTVNHKDGDTRNNAVSNLEWATQSEQMYHAHASGLVSGTNVSGTSNGRSKLDWAAVASIRASSCKGVDLAKLYGVSKATISEVRSGKVWVATKIA